MDTFGEDPADKPQVNSDILAQMLNSRQEPELSTFQAVGEIGFRKDEEYKTNPSMSSAAP
jgi:hypothetical protein